ncbi:HNH endonuclease [Mycolicibacterium sp. 3033]|nr:HNH endonuclease [Mycolicibacterium aurantiacum]
MFDGSLPGPAALADISDGELIEAITGWAGAAAAAQARLLAAVAERRRRAETTADADPARTRWACDPVDEAAAQIGCALTVSHGRAVALMDTAVTLREHLPRLNARFLAGQVSERVVARIVWLCALVVDEQVWAQLDEQFATAASTWGTLSGDKLDTAITVWIHTLDPDAVRRAATAHRGRDVRIGGRDQAAGTTSVWGRINSLDAAIAAARLKAMVNSVCGEDPRTTAQKRADAFGAVFAGAFHLSCLCGTPDCPVAAVPDARATSITVHVVADHTTLTATPDPALHGNADTPNTDAEADAELGPEPVPGPDTEPARAPEPAHSAHPSTANLQPPPPTAEHTAPEPQPHADPPPAPAGEQPAPAAPARPAVILGLRGAVLPPAVLAEVLTRGATVRTVADPRALPVTPGYRPTTAHDEFVRCRDLTCRIPGCDRPALGADLDHSNPWPAGPTHPSNLNGKCRLHHLLKTFWEGWTEQQRPDGTLHLSTPTGHTYTTRPFSALLFPTWATTTDPPPPRPPEPPPTAPPRHHPGRTLKMPLRQRTRAENRAAYITAARQHNALQAELDRAAEQAAADKRRNIRRRTAAAIDALKQSINPPSDYGDDPPPF